MIKKKIYTWRDVEKMCSQILVQLYNSEWRPDYIVGITRGGNVPATILSNMTGIRCEAVKVALRDGESGKTGDSIAWMADDAKLGKNILVVDDINDTGATLKLIERAVDKKEIKIYFASLIENNSSAFKVDFRGKIIDKSLNPSWIVFPWEKYQSEHYQG